MLVIQHAEDFNKLDLTIDSVIEKFNNHSILEEIEDWQGTKDYKGYKMKVLRNVIISDLPITDDVARLIKGCKPDLPWAEDHFKERISGEPTNPGETYKYWPYHTNLDADDKYKQEIFSHTYQERFWPKTPGDAQFRGFCKEDRDNTPNVGIRFELGDLNDVISLLKANPLTRQAYLPIWFPEDTWAANNSQRVPCTLGYYFWVYDNELYCNYTIRSCDLFRHFRNDVYLTSRLLQYIAKHTNLGVGKLNMFIYNLHIFENDTYAFNKKEKNLKNI